MPPTIKYIARKAGVSIATVSRAMNGEDGVGPETRERIQIIARRLNYFPNLSARGLVARKPNAIGIVIPRMSEFAFSNPYYSEILKGIEKKTRESGHYLVFSFAEEDCYARMVQHQLAAGVIVLANRMDDPRVEEAWRMKVPMVLIPGDSRQPGIPSVDVDNTGAAVQAVDHLAGLGHRRIAFLNGPANSKYSLERLTGFRNGLKKCGLPLRKEFVMESDFTQQGGYEGTKRFLSLKNPPTALLVINDYSAMGALRAAKEMGFRVPEDVSLIGFGDVPFSSMTDPPLTTLREPFQEMGHEAASMLLKIVQGKKISSRNQILPVELVPRESTAPFARREGKAR
jgi:DNA-binding LacI/PurR family transcriptional regulator